VKETDPELQARQTEIDPLAGKRRVDAVVPMRSNLLRLEHELQTVVGGGLLGPAAILALLTVSRARALAAHRCPHVHHGKPRLLRFP
jgi:hypothetical protein